MKITLKRKAVKLIIAAVKCNHDDFFDNVINNKDTIVQGAEREKLREDANMTSMLYQMMEMRLKYEPGNTFEFDFKPETTRLISWALNESVEIASFSGDYGESLYKKWEHLSNLIDFRLMFEN